MSTTFFHGGSLTILYSEKDHDRMHDLFHLQLFLLKLVGLVPISVETYVPKRWERTATNLAKLYCVFLLFCTSHVALLYGKTTYDLLQVGQLEEISDALIMAIIYSVGAFAACYCLWRFKFLVSFLEYINEQHRHHSLAGLTFISAYTSYKVAYKLTLYWVLSCIVGTGLWSLQPLIMRSRSLPLKCWYPFDSLQPFVFELLYAYQIWCQLIVALIFGTCSALFGSTIIIMLGQFDILYCSLKNLYYHAQLMSGESIKYLRKLQFELPSEGEEVNQYVYSQEYTTHLSVFETMGTREKQSIQTALHKSLVECVQLHQFILRSCEKLEDLFNIYCLAVSLEAMSVLCLLIFVGVEGERTTLRIVILIGYIALTFSNMFVLAYFGNLIRSHSIRAGDAFFRSKWFPHAHYIKRDVFIFLINTRRAVKLTAGKFYLMDIERLRSVITQAFSFLTLLQNMAEKN